MDKVKEILEIGCKKTYVTPAVDSVGILSEDICLLSVSDQKPPMRDEEFEDEESESYDNPWTSNSVWKN